MRLWRMIRRSILSLFPSYRPERHYMRGPGPKWLEIHGRLETLPSKAQRTGTSPSFTPPQDVALLANIALAAERRTLSDYGGGRCERTPDPLMSLHLFHSKTDIGRMRRD